MSFASSRHDIMKECRAKFPHCDEFVLHSPGECVYFDMHPKQQKLRIKQGVNFTGHNDPSKTKCPATQRRDLEIIDQWHGNRALSHEDIIIEEVMLS